MALRALIHDESGGMTAFGLFTFTSAMMIGGLAIDVQHAIAARTHTTKANVATALQIEQKRHAGTELQQQGKIDEARASLAEFRRRYPDAVLPPELRKLEP